MTGWKGLQQGHLDFLPAWEGAGIRGLGAAHVAHVRLLLLAGGDHKEALELPGCADQDRVLPVLLLADRERGRDRREMGEGGSPRRASTAPESDSSRLPRRGRHAWARGEQPWRRPAAARFGRSLDRLSQRLLRTPSVAGSQRGWSRRRRRGEDGRGPGAGEDGAARSKVHGAARSSRGPARTSEEAPECALRARLSTVARLARSHSTPNRSLLLGVDSESPAAVVVLVRELESGSHSESESRGRWGEEERRIKTRRGYFSARCSGLLRPWRRYRAELKGLYLAARDRVLHRVSMRQKPLRSCPTVPVHLGICVRVVGPLPA